MDKIKNFVKKNKTQIIIGSSVAASAVALWMILANGKSPNSRYPYGTDFDKMEEELASIEEA